MKSIYFLSLCLMITCIVPIFATKKDVAIKTLKQEQQKEHTLLVNEYDKKRADIQKQFLDAMNKQKEKETIRENELNEIFKKDRTEAEEAELDVLENEESKAISQLREEQTIASENLDKEQEEKTQQLKTKQLEAVLELAAKPDKEFEAKVDPLTIGGFEVLNKINEVKKIMTLIFDEKNQENQKKALNQKIALRGGDNVPLINALLRFAENKSDQSSDYYDLANQILKNTNFIVNPNSSNAIDQPLYWVLNTVASGAKNGIQPYITKQAYANALVLLDQGASWQK